MGQFTRGKTTISYGTKKVGEEFQPMVFVDGVLSSEQIASCKHSKTAWRRAKKLARLLWLRVLLAIPADLSGVRKLLLGAEERQERLAYA